MTSWLQYSPSARRDGPLRTLFCANPGYFQHVAVAAVSLAENNRQSTIDVHLLTCDRNAAAEEMLRASLECYCYLTLTIHHISSEVLEQLFVDKHVSKETYLRLLAPEVLPSEMDRIIYLDSDVVVLDDLQPLWNTEFDHEAVAAAPDYTHPLALVPGLRAALGIPEDRTYVNAGVLVLDLQRWRREKLTQRLFDYIEHQGTLLALHDQDAINAVLYDAICVVDCRWNLQARMYRLERRSFPTEFAATRNARRRPAIIHFTGPEKPWLFRSRAARKKDYFRYLNKTAWRQARPALTTTMENIEYRADRILSRAGIDYLQVLYKLRRAREELGKLVAAPTRRPFKSMTAIIGRVGSAALPPGRRF